MPSMNKITRAILILLVQLISQAVAEFCTGYGHVCNYPHRCCSNTCCLPEGYGNSYNGFRWSVWNMWYFWFIVIFILMSCFGGCGYWRRRQLLLSQGQSGILMPGSYANILMGRRPTTQLPQSTHVALPIYHAYDPPFNGRHEMNANRPVQGYFPSPPPYSEVIKKPYYPPSKDELPPYPGDPTGEFTTEEMGTATTTFISLPPYSAVAEPSSVGSRYTSAEPSSASIRAASPDPAGSCSMMSPNPTNQNSALYSMQQPSTTSANQRRDHPADETAS